MREEEREKEEFREGKRKKERNGLLNEEQKWIEETEMRKEE
jgi:hypothetical protein